MAVWIEKQINFDMKKKETLFYPFVWESNCKKTDNPYLIHFLFSMSRIN